MIVLGSWSSFWLILGLLLAGFGVGYTLALAVAWRRARRVRQMLGITAEEIEVAYGYLRILKRQDPGYLGNLDRAMASWVVFLAYLADDYDWRDARKHYQWTYDADVPFIAELEGEEEEWEKKA